MLKDLKLSGFTAVGILFVCLISFMFIYFMGPLSLPETDLINDSMSRPTLVKSITRSFENPFEGLAPAISQPGVGPAAPINITDEDIKADIANGLYTEEDYAYLVSIGAESSYYEGFYAVACCVRNRVNSGGGSIKSVVTAAGQFAGYRADEVGKPRNNEVKAAALAVLRGGTSTIGTSRYFFGRVNGYDLWYESSKGPAPVVVGTGPYRNVFYPHYGYVHNSVEPKTPDAIIIYDASSGTWK